MPDEAIGTIRRLWGGRDARAPGRHHVVANAHPYTARSRRRRSSCRGSAPSRIALAARVGDGFVSVMPDAEAVRAFRSGGGGDGPCQGGLKVRWGPDEAEARRIAHRRWLNEGLPGELAQILPTPPHFEQAVELVTEEMVAEAVTCGPDLDRHVEAITREVEAGFDEVYVQQIRRALLGPAVVLVLLVPLAASGAAAGTSSAESRNSPTSDTRRGDGAVLVAWVVGGLVVAGIVVGGVSLALPGATSPAPASRRTRRRRGPDRGRAPSARRRPGARPWPSC